MQGNIRKVVNLFQQHRYTGEKNYKEQAEALLNEIISSCNRSIPLFYHHGLCGIGAAIEYLIRNDFVKGEADEILEDIDKAVISVINNRPPIEANIENGLLGLACYMYERLYYRTKSEDPIVLTLKEHIIYLIDWMEDMLLNNTIEKKYYEYYFVLILLHQLNIFNVKIEKMLEWCDHEIEHKEQYLQKQPDEKKGYANSTPRGSQEEALKRIPPISIVIPLRIESSERRDNLHCVLQYLLQSPFIHIDLLEADRERRFFFNPHERIRYNFVYDEENVFYRTHYLNVLLKKASFPIVGVWDTDVLIPESQLVASIKHIMEGCVLCFPYNGNFRYLNNERSKVIREDINRLQKDEGRRLMGRPSVGGAFLINRDKYLQAGGENEGFYGWGPEDAERVKRLEILGLPISRTKGSLYHLNHERKPDIGIDNQKKAQHNQKVLINTCEMSKTELKYMVEKHVGIFSYLNNLEKLDPIY